MYVGASSSFLIVFHSIVLWYAFLIKFYLECLEERQQCYVFKVILASFETTQINPRLTKISKHLL